MQDSNTIESLTVAIEGNEQDKAVDIILGQINKLEPDQQVQDDILKVLILAAEKGYSEVVAEILKKVPSGMNMMQKRKREHINGV